jgi:hypothetical protein
MNRTHKLARGDHDGLSLRVAHQMQHAVNPPMAQSAARVRTRQGGMKSAIPASAGSETSTHSRAARR